MAITKLRQDRLGARTEARIREALVAEFRRPEDVPPPPGNPLIYQEESGTPERFTHWYVVWHAFAGVDSEDRSRVILDSVEEVFGREAVLRVTTAMGLVPDEPLAKDLAGQAEPSQMPKRSRAVAEDRTEYKIGPRNDRR